jgi:hypothetical protein
MKQKYALSIVLLHLINAQHLTAQYYRWVFHRDLPITYAANSAGKIVWLELYAEKMNDVKKAREKTVEYLAVVEEVQRKIYNSLTNVDAALKNGKTVLLIGKRIEAIYQNLKLLSTLAYDRPYLATLAVDQTRLFTARLTQLANNLGDVILKSDKETLIDPVKRTKLVADVYSDVWALWASSRALINIFKAYNLQDAVNRVVPVFDWFKNDKAIVDDILKNIKF